MTTFIFCLIFIQVSIFLIAGIVLVSTFYVSLRSRPAEEQETVREEKAVVARPARGFCLADAALTRSELNYLLGA